MSTGSAPSDPLDRLLRASQQPTARADVDGALRCVNDAWTRQIDDATAARLADGIRAGLPTLDVDGGRLHISPIDARDGGGVWVVADLTPEHRARQDRLLRVAARLGRIGGWLVELDTGRCTWSEGVGAIADVLRPDAAEPTDATWAVAPEWREALAAHYARCAASGEPFRVVLQIVHRSGRRAWVRALGEGVRDERGAIRWVQGAVQNIDAQVRAEEALRESEHRFREFGESMPMIVWSATADGTVDHQTRAMHRYAGWSAEQLAGHGWVQLVHPDDRAAMIERWRSCVASGGLFQFEYRLRRFDGEYRWHLVRASPFVGPDGQIAKWFGTSIDMHEERALRDHAEDLARQLSATLESVTDGFYLVDRRWRLAFVNGVAARWLQRPREALLGIPWHEAFPDAVGTPIERAFIDAMNGGGAFHGSHVDPTSQRVFELRATPSGEGLAVSFRDVTELRAAERRLREQAELLDRASDAIVVLGDDGRAQSWNAGATRLYGWAPDDAVGQPVARLTGAPLDPVALASTRQMGAWSGELEHRRRDGASITVEASWSLVSGHEGQPDRILAIHTDVTERKRLMAQFLRAQRLESIGTLAGGIAHDLNNVLAPILLAIGMLLEELPDPSSRELLETIQTSAQRGADMVQQVLRFARGSAPQRQRVHLDQILSDLSRFLRDSFPKSILWHVELSPGLWPLLGDPTQILQVLMNLAVNARDAMPHGGKLTITAVNHSPSPSDRRVRITVRDDGLGMSADVLARVFDPFFTTKEVGQGTGLGMSTALTIVRSHGGQVHVESTPGEGTMVRVDLPVSDEIGPVDAEPQRAGAPSGRGERVLLVDDDRAVREVSRRALEAGGYRVLTAVHGADAMAVYELERGQFDVVISDIRMPSMDGPSLMRSLRARDPRIKLIAVSGLDAPELPQGARVLRKPYDREALLAAVREILDLST